MALNLGIWREKNSGFIRFDEFEMLICEFRVKNPSTGQLTSAGETLCRDLSTETASTAQAQDFLKQVCKWGGDENEIYEKVVEAPTGASLNLYFEKAVNKLRRVRLEEKKFDNLLSEALLVLAGEGEGDKGVTGLGASYGSKVLRFLRPDVCGVLDSRIAGQANFDTSSNLSGAASFAGYSRQCIEIAGILNYLGIKHPSQPNWTAGEVDSAIYCRSKGWA